MIKLCWPQLATCARTAFAFMTVQSETAEPGDIHLTVLDGETDRLDKWITLHVPALTRTRAQTLIRDGNVSIGDGVVWDASRHVKAGEQVSVRVPPSADAEPEGEVIPLKVMFEDKHLIVIDKPPGLVVHPSAGHATGTLVNALIAHCGASLSGIGGVKRPGIVHRLDKDTSGLLVVAKTDAAHQGLSEQFASHGADGRLQRTYQAVVWGVPLRRSGRIDAPLARSTHNRTKISVTGGAKGRHAVTHYEVTQVFNGQKTPGVASLVELNLETGRTHQIRVHLASLGHPVMGDAAYGAGFKASSALLGDEARAALLALNRQALHAAVLGFEHPVTGKSHVFKSALPADLARLHAALTSS
jgi:23S rRNA pseudouridine1911/1915/1917 synthase